MKSKFGLRFFLIALTIVALLAIAFSASPVLAAGEGSVSITEDTILTRDYIFSGNGFVIGADNITLDMNGYTITGEALSFSRGILVMGRNGITIKNGTITGFSQGVQLFNADNNVIQDVISQNNTENGIHIMSDSDKNLIDDCTLKSNGTNGVFIGYGVSPSNNNTVQNCTISNNPDGINAYDSVGNSLVRNTINNFSGSGIFLKYSESNHVLFNRVSNDGVSDGQGIHLDDACSFNVIQGNNISTCGVAGIISDGIDSEENLVQGNNISNCVGVGIRIHGTKHEVQGNNITASTRGIALVHSSKENWVQNNNISKSGRAGIGISGTNNHVLNNKIKNTSGAGIGISSSDSEVIGNKVSYSARDGIVLFPPATGNSVEDNKVSYSNFNGIAAVAGPNGAATDNTIMKNKVNNSDGYDLYDWNAEEPANTWIDNVYTTSNF